MIAERLKNELTELHQLMLAMLQEAKNTNWQELSRLDSERRVLLNYAANASKAVTVEEPGQSSAQASAITDELEILGLQLRDLDRQINETVFQARARIMNANRDLREQVKAKQSYASTDAI